MYVCVFEGRRQKERRKKTVLHIFTKLRQDGRDGERKKRNTHTHTKILSAFNIKLVYGVT